jgi:hypothetical protein
MHGVVKDETNKKAVTLSSGKIYYLIYALKVEKGVLLGPWPDNNTIVKICIHRGTVRI